MSRLRGSCLCGACSYEVEDDFEYSLICHCSQCRRATGSAFKPFAGIVSNKLQMTCERVDTLRYGDEMAYDVHCKHCGSLLFSSVRDHQYVHVTLGTLIDSPSLKPTAHIFVGSKASWFEISDQLPQYDEFPSR